MTVQTLYRHAKELFPLLDSARLVLAFMLRPSIDSLRVPRVVDVISACRETKCVIIATDTSVYYIYDSLLRNLLVGLAANGSWQAAVQSVAGRFI